MKFDVFFEHICKFSKKIAVILAVTVISVNLYAQNNTDDVTTITIKNSGQTSYQKDPETGNDQIVLEGAVELSVRKGTTTSDIIADKITYDRKTEMLYADGNVQIKTNGSSGSDTATASSFLMNAATLEGVFDGGKIVQTKSEALNLPSGSVLVVFSDIFGKTSANTIAFKNSSLTFCDDENPHWRIDAFRTWLLPGGEFAFLNALLYVGSVPVLYLPAFYYPKDELVFNPVFTTRPREGYSVQTTTYLFGRKQDTSSSFSSSSSSGSSADAATEASVKAIYNFMRSTTQKEQRLEGLVLHNLEENYKGGSSDYLKLLGDWYSNLGYMVGVDGAYSPKDSFISKVAGKLYLGFSNTIYKDYSTGKYTAFNSKGEKTNDTVSFLGINDIPFRFGGNLLDFSISKPIRFSISMPVYSDPLFQYDFITNRSESMDWISYLFELSRENNDTPVVSESSGFRWIINSSYSPVLPDFVKPLLGSVSISANSSVDFTSKNVDREYLSADVAALDYAPGKKFYFPSQIQPVTSSMSLSGTFFEYPRSSATGKNNQSVSFDIPLNKPEEFLTEKEIEEKIKQKEEKNEQIEEVESENKDKSSDETEEIILNPSFPELTSSINSVTVNTGLTYKLGYNISPRFDSQFSYDSSNLKRSSDFKLEDMESFMYTLKSPVSLTSNLGYGGSFFTMSNNVNFDATMQDHLYSKSAKQLESDLDLLNKRKDELSSKVNKTVSEQKELSDINNEISLLTGKIQRQKNLMPTDYRAQKVEITEANTVSLKPFSYIPLLSETGLSYNVSFKVFRTKFDDDRYKINSDNPEWIKYWLFDEDEEKNPLSDRITTHSLTATLGAKEFDSKFKQSLNLSTTLKPQVPRYSISGNFTFPFINVSASQSWQETSLKDSTLKTNPLSQSLSISFPKNTSLPAFIYKYNDKVIKASQTIVDILTPLSFSESYSLAWETKTGDNDIHSENLKLSLTWKQLTASYVQSYTTGYDWSNGNDGKSKGWHERSEKEFIPYSFSLSLSTPSTTFYRWFNRISISPALSSAVTADLIRPTNSSFTFSPTLSIKINQFMTFSFSATSKNTSLYWYFQDDPEGRYADVRFGNNPFSRICVDLWDSFRFGENNDSYRKHSGFKLDSMNFTLTHEMHDWKFNMNLKIAPRIVNKKYNYEPYITIGFVWNPMESIKAEIKDEYGKWSLN